MKTPAAKLYLRVLLPDGSRPYAAAAFSANEKLRDYYAVITGTPEHHAGRLYYLRYTSGGRRIWELVGNDASVALVALQRRNHAFQAVSLGITPIPVEKPAESNSSTAKLVGRSLPAAVEEYLLEIANHKSPKTHLAYSLTLKLFLKCCRKDKVEALDRKDLLAYVSFLKLRGNAPRTIRNRVDYLQIFLHWFGLPSVLKGSDLPKFTEKAVRAYSQEEIRRFLDAATSEERDLVQFFLCTGTREQEIQYAAYGDIDFGAATFTVTEKLDLGFRPKDKEEGSIPIPDALVKTLREHRLKHPSDRLIFPGPNGKPNGHLLLGLSPITPSGPLQPSVKPAGHSDLRRPINIEILGLL